MKLILPALLFFCFPAFSQTTQNAPENSADFTVVTDPKTYGYINGIRLDSLEAVYAEFSRYRGEGLYFDYGQKRGKRKDMAITDQKGKLLVFVPYTTAAFLNFFYFNGWQLDKALSASDGSVSPYIMMKKQ